MKSKLVIIFLSLLFISCSKQTQKENSKHIDKMLHSIDIPAQTVDKSSLSYNNKKSVWTLSGDGRDLFSGYAVSFYPDSTLKQRFGIFKGKKQNEFEDWHPDGHLKNSANYHQGKLHGEKKSWSSDSSHILLAHLNYYLGKAHGEQKIWYPSGEIFKILNLNMGKEEGIQRAFRKNGDLYANYEAKEGRIYGLKKAALCYELEDENIINEK